MTALHDLGPRLRNLQVRVITDIEYSERGHGAVVLKFSDGSNLRAHYWRLIVDGRAAFSSFDQEQRYGLPTPIDAKEELHKVLNDRVCTDARLDTETGDLAFTFAPAIHLQVFRFTCFEDWELMLPEGDGGYSNSILK